MDKKLFHSLYGFGVKTGAVKAATMAAVLSQPVFAAAFLLGLTLSFIYNGAGSMLAFAISCAACLFVNSFFRKAINRERPFVKEGVKCYINHDETGSMPSNHAASAMVISVAWFAVSPYVGAALVAMSVVTGLSRIFVGVHYPGDVLAGWLVGVFFGFLGLMPFF